MSTSVYTQICKGNVQFYTAFNNGHDVQVGLYLEQNFQMSTLLNVIYKHTVTAAQ